MHKKLLCIRSSEVSSRPQPWSLVAISLTSAVVLAFGTLSTKANESQGVLDYWSDGTFGIASCAGGLEGPDNELSTAADCVADQLLSGLLDVAFQYVDEHGDALFGEHFHLDHRLSLSASGGGLSGDLDAVIPLNSFSTISGENTSRAVFLQHGLTRWKDEYGFQRNDIRFGVVHRMAVSEQPDAGVFGTSVFFQENLEREHVRIVSGVDYLDRWGSGSLTWFMPATDWRPGRSGYEERALEGLELELRTDVTSTIEFQAAAGRWEDKNSAEAWITRGRLGIQWRPHPRLGLQGSWDDIGTEEESLGLHAVVAVPFGGREGRRPRWQGLGLGSQGSTQPDTGAIWNSVNNVGQIEVTERQVTQEEETDDLLNSEPQPSFNQMATDES